MNKKGVTLLEMLLVLVIITAIILIASRYYQQASEASKVSEATAKVKRIIEASYEWQKVNHTFEGLNMNDLVDTGLLSASDTKGPWGELFSVQGIRYQGRSIQIEIRIPNVPKTACYALQDILDLQNINTVNFDCSHIGANNSKDIYAIYPKT